MTYFKDLKRELEQLVLWMDLAHEQGINADPVETDIRSFLDGIKHELNNSHPTVGYPYDEPNDLADIRELRPAGPRKLPLSLTDEELYNRILGAWLGRSAGCVLGVPVEGRSRAFIEAWTRKLDQPYPLSEYFKDYPGAGEVNYVEPKECFLKAKIGHVGTDDDLAYSVLGILILEEYGLDFTSENVGRAWLKYLPFACTAEEVALRNLRNGLQPPDTALVGNPYTEWIGADIRSDPWGYAAPGLPELAAEFAHRDATVSHTRNGIYGEMFFSASISAAFAVKTAREALEIGATEIPAKSRMAETVAETIDWVEKDRDWDKTWKRIMERYDGMHNVHTLNNAALTIAGLLYADGDFERAIGLTVMGGFDTDCTGATAGSIMGAIIGAKNLPEKWVGSFNDHLSTYLIGSEKHSISDLAQRTFELAKRTRSLQI